MADQEHDSVSLKPSNGELTSLAITLVSFVRLSNLAERCFNRFRRGALVPGIKAGNGLHQPGLALDGLDQMSPVHLECSIVEQVNGRDTDDHSSRGHHQNEEQETASRTHLQVTCCWLVEARCSKYKSGLSNITRHIKKL